MRFGFVPAIPTCATRLPPRPIPPRPIPACPPKDYWRGRGTPISRSLKRRRHRLADAGRWEAGSFQQFDSASTYAYLSDPTPASRPKD